MSDSSAHGKSGAPLALPVLWKCLVAPLLLVSANLALAQEASNFDCLIEPWEQVDISFADHGIVSFINVEKGQSVATGDVLAGLESGVEMASVELRRHKANLAEEIRAAEASEAFSKRNLERLQDLYKNKAVPMHKVDEAETDVTVAENRAMQARENQKLAQLELHMAEEMLGRRTISSPIDGVVLERQKAVGEYLEEEPVLSLAQIDPLRVQVLMPVALFGQVKPGMRAMVTPEAPLADHRNRAEVVVVDRNIDVASGTFGVQLQLDNPGDMIPSGLKCSVNFEEEQLLATSP